MDGENLIDPPQAVTYYSVVSRDSVWILPTIYALNDLDVRFFDIQNDQIYAEIDENFYFKTGTEFGPNIGGWKSVIVIVIALYGLKPMGSFFYKQLVSRLTDLGYKTFLANTDTCIKKYVNPCDLKYYEYVRTFVDDMISVSDMSNRIVKMLQYTYIILESRIKSLFDK